MALDFTAFNQALDDVAAGLVEVANAIANAPAADTAGQSTLDEATAKLQGFASQLSDMKTAEDNEDTTGSSTTTTTE